MMAAPRDSLAELSSQGAFVRSASVFTGRLGTKAWPTDCGRYVLYVSLACPWASRCLAFLALKGLEHAIEVVHVCPKWAATKPGVDEHRGWVFRARAERGEFNEVPLLDPVFQAETLRGVYEAAEPDAGVAKFTVPLLLDRVTKSVVCNESSLIIRDLNSAFNAHAKFPLVDLYPPHLAQEIDALNTEMYESINNGVYKCGFATTQSAYDAAASALAAGLTKMNDKLTYRRYLAGNQLTEADIRLFVTLVRYDPVYVVHFKTAFRCIRSDYPALLGFMQDVYHQSSGAQGASVGSTVSMNHIKAHYYGSHPKINPYGIVPAAHPAEGIELLQPHGREAM